jgi:CHAP domain
MISQGRLDKSQPSRIRNRIAGLSLVVVTGLVAITSIGVMPAQADTTPTIYGSQWLNGAGVNACSMTGHYDSTCGGDPAVGSAWQCVELAQRLYYRRGWYTANGGYFPDVGSAYQIWGQASAMGMITEANGSITSIVPGDMIVHGQGISGDAGHVAIVDYVGSDGVHVVEQNYNSSAHEAVYGFGNGTLSRTLYDSSGHVMPVLGVVHSPKNPNGNSSGDVQMFIRGDSSVFATNTFGGSWTQETDPGNAVAIAAGGSYQMFLRNDGTVFARNSISDRWTQETDPGTANLIAASSTGVQMIRTSANDIWAKKSIGYGAWTQVVGPGNAVAIAVGGDTMMFIRGDAAVFAKNYYSTGWTQETSPGNARTIAASSTGVQMFIRGDNAVFATNSIGGTWTQETASGNAEAIAVGGNTQMFLRGDSAVFATNSIGGTWTQETNPTAANLIAVTSDGVQIIRTSANDLWAKSTISNGGWIQEVGPGNASAIAAG